MRHSMLHGKLHGLRVTGADLHYEGSVKLDPQQYQLVGIVPFEFVEIWNKASGARITTYVIPGAPGSRCCVLNGAAARTCQVGDELIIAARIDVEDGEIENLKPRVVIFDAQNNVLSVDEHSVSKTTQGGWAVQTKRKA
jgi:aspartate 1-decarboxylase